MKFLAGLGLGAVFLVGAVSIAVAQPGDALSAALGAAKAGEQADGYLGVRSPISPEARDELDAINIKRRAAYTQRAGLKGATVKEYAATIGCETLSARVDTGRAYLLTDGVWRVKTAAAINLPSYCPK